jgi:hypothetical protein
MGKVDDLRALREARFAANQKAQPPAERAKKAQRALAKATSAPAPTGELCGHRSIGNKTCTREKDHQATGTKSHRYSSS